MPYQRAFSTLGIPEATIDDALALAAKFSLDGVELRALGGTIDLPAHFASAWGTPAALAGHLRGARVRIVSLDTSLHLIGGAAEERAKFLEFMPWAEALGVRWLRVFDGGRDGGPAEIAAGAAALRWWQDERRARGWRAEVMIETHDSLTSASAIRRLAEAAPGAWFLWDAFNTWLRSGEDPAATWPQIRDRVAHVHVKDCVRVPSGAHPFTYVLPGTGVFPMAPLRRELSAGFAGTVSLEWERLWHPHLPPLADALESAAARGWW